jgi:hypothetical protein
VKKSVCDTLGLTTRQRAELDREFLRRLVECGRPATVAELFDRCEPQWAVEAADRLQVAARVRELPDGRLDIVRHGEKAA